MEFNGIFGNYRPFMPEISQKSANGSQCLIRKVTFPLMNNNFKVTRFIPSSVLMKWVNVTKTTLQYTPCHKYLVESLLLQITITSIPKQSKHFLDFGIYNDLILNGTNIFHVLSTTTYWSVVIELHKIVSKQYDHLYFMKCIIASQNNVYNDVREKITIRLISEFGKKRPDKVTWDWSNKGGYFTSFIPIFTRGGIRHSVELFVDRAYTNNKSNSFHNKESKVSITFHQFRFLFTCRYLSHLSHVYLWYPGCVSWHFLSNQTWNTAAAYCQSIGGSLLTYNSDNLQLLHTLSVDLMSYLLMVNMVFIRCNEVSVIYIYSIVYFITGCLHF